MGRRVSHRIARTQSNLLLRFDPFNFSATNNRRQWEREGAAITAKMLKDVEQEYDMLPEAREQAGPLPTHVEEDGAEDEA
jgi:hypothetical protein